MTTAEIEANSAFGERVSAALAEVKATYGSKPPATTRKKRESLSSVGKVDPSTFAPSAPTDPYALLDLYGREQFRVALERYPSTELKTVAAIVDEHNPGTRPSNRGQKVPLIDYIVRYVAEQ